MRKQPACGGKFLNIRVQRGMPARETLMKSYIYCVVTFVVLLFGLRIYPSADQPPLQPLQFHVRISSEVKESLVSGRLIVLLSTKQDTEKALSPGFGDDAESVWLAAKEIHDLKLGEEVEIGPGNIAFPRPLEAAPPGDYQAMAVLDVNHDYAYRGLHGGDLRSQIVPLKHLDPARSKAVDLVLTQRVTDSPITLPPSGELLEFVSPSLSAFWGRPIAMRAVILLPPSYGREKQRTYPVVYWTHGFGGHLKYLAKSVAPRYEQMMVQHKIPEMIYVFLDESCPGGTHEFADSVNNGPWGKALTKELIPYLEGKYRMYGRAEGRLLTGHSSGGWAALWLQIAYPTFFGGTWPTSPDPADFRDFIGIDLHRGSQTNFYHKSDGSPRPLVRMNGHEAMSLEQTIRQEEVMGEEGGQFESFEWVFSPRGQDGRPQKLFDRQSGQVDPAVEQAWKKYDIAEILRKNAVRLRPLLQDKIHLTVGKADTFHLDESAHQLESVLKELGIRAQFSYLEGRNHFDLFDGGLEEQIAREMEKTAHKEHASRGLAHSPRTVSVSNFR